MTPKEKLQLLNSKNANTITILTKFLAFLNETCMEEATTLWCLVALISGQVNSLKDNALAMSQILEFEMNN